MKRRRNLFIALGAIALYLILISLLRVAESSSPDSNITSFPIAVWYSLTTLTTVGYGDTYPVTLWGRVIGAVFQLLSLGLLVFLISLIVTLLRGRLLPSLRMLFMNRRTWYVFSHPSPEAQILAEAIQRERPNGMILYAGEKEAEGEKLPLGTQTILSLEEILSRHFSKSDVYVFCMGPSGRENFALARALEGHSCKVYGMTQYMPEHTDPNMTLFDPYTCCARLYWQRYPVSSVTERVFMIGEGGYAEAILFQALQNNVLDNHGGIQYRIFGDFDNFRRNHPYLYQIAPAEETEGRDSLIFEDDPWNGDLDLLKTADRIIVCCSTEDETAELLTQLQRFCPVICPVYAKLSVPFEAVTTFGAPEEIFTPDLVLNASLDATAVALHRIYCCNTHSSQLWCDLSSFTRRSNLASADHMMMKIRFLLGPQEEEAVTPELCRKAYDVFTQGGEELRDRCRRMEHERWMRFHLLYNWQYAPERDNARRRHTMLVPFDQLTPEDQTKDDYAWDLLGTLAQNEK